MIIILKKKDIMMNILNIWSDVADTDIKDQLEKYYSYWPVKPEITIDNDIITINIKMPEIEKYENNLNEAKDLASRWSYFKAKKTRWTY